MRTGTKNRRLPEIIEALAIPNPFDIGQFLATLALQRHRTIYLHPFTSGPGTPCGMWISTASADHIFHENGTTPWHKTHIITHEIAHMLLGHQGTTLPDTLAHLIAPNVNPALAQLILSRTAYTTVEELEAEALASLILERGSSVSRPAPVLNHDARAVIRRLERTWGRSATAAENLAAPGRLPQTW